MSARTVPTRTLWNDGPEVGAIGLGCMGMTWAYKADDRTESPDRVIGHALDLGVNFIDTADVYGPFTNEEVVGEALGSRRDEVILATKGGLVSHVGDAGEPVISGPNGKPDHLRQAIDDSLRRLGVDHIDLYYLHRPDPEVDVEDSIGAMAEAVQPERFAHSESRSSASSNWIGPNRCIRSRRCSRSCRCGHAIISPRR